MLSKESLASLDILISSVKDSIGSIPREKEAEVILQKEDWSHHGWYLWKMVASEIQKRMGLFSKVEIDDVCVDNSDCKEDRTIHWSNKPDGQSNSLH